MVSPSKAQLIANLAFKSRPGALPGKPIKTNQDSYIVIPKFLGDSNIGFYAVADGHGLYGHNVSRFVKRILPSTIAFHLIPNPLCLEVMDSHLRGKDMNSKKIIKKALVQSYL